MVKETQIPDDYVVPGGSVKRGAKLFKRYCTRCHSIHPDNHLPHGPVAPGGPTLWNCYLRTSGIAKGHASISHDLENSGLVWNDANLMRYMRDPSSVIEGHSSMVFSGIADYQTRIDIIHFLKTLTWGNKIGERYLEEFMGKNPPNGDSR